MAPRMPIKAYPPPQRRYQAPPDRVPSVAIFTSYPAEKAGFSSPKSSPRSSFDGSTPPSSPSPSTCSSSFSKDDDEKRRTSFDEKKPTETQTQEEKPYHTFSPLRKKMLLYLVSLAALYSPLSSNIYFPALPTIANELHVSQALVTLSVTTYMIAQGIAPSFWGFLADSLGRRPILLATFLLYIVANIGLSQVKSFEMLLFWRAVQAAGSSSTISIGAGVIGDIATPSERAGFVGTFGGLRMLGQSVGPVLGGLLSQYLGFRSIFYFLLISSGITAALVGLLLPETLRDIAGDGSVELSGWVYTPWISVFRKSSHSQNQAPSGKERPKLKWFTIIEPLRFLFEKDVFATLLFGSVVYTVWSMVTASTSSTFKARYGYNDLIIGLCFLPNGIGCVLGSSVTGKIMDADFRAASALYKEKNPSVTLKKGSLPDDFPVEHTRLRRTPYLSVIFFFSVLLYGWSLRLDVVSPLLLQFCIAYSATAVFGINSTVVIDLYPGKSASATAVNNLARCSVGAVGVAFVEKMIRAFGGDTGYAFTTLAIAFLAFTPLLWIEMKYGGKWRRERNERLRARETKGKGEGMA